MNITKSLITETRINSYHDFSGLTQLKASTQENPKDENTIRKVAQQFEATFVQEMMRTMRQATIKSELIESSGMETFEGLFDKEVALQISKHGGMGVADLLVKQLGADSNNSISSIKKGPEINHNILTDRNQSSGSFEIVNNKIFPLELFNKYK